MKTAVWGAAALVLAFASAAMADDDAGRAVRLIGAAPGAEDPMAKAFVLDLTVTKADGMFKEDVKGWYAALPPTTGSGAVTGSCVRNQCAIDVDQSDGKLSLTGDFTGGGASSGVFAVADDEGKPKTQGPASYSALSGPIPGVGDLAAPNAVTGPDLKSLLDWSGGQMDTGNFVPDMPDDSMREGLATWQQGQNEPATGLITTVDLATLRTNADAAKAKAGWTKIGDDKRGWSAGYPAALLPKATTVGAEQHFTSADGAATLVVAIEPAISGDDFSARMEKETADAPGRSSNNYTRVNGDMTQTYVQDGHLTVAVYHNREGGLARLVFTRPADKSDDWALYDNVIASSFSVSDDLKAP
jgi:hypothetical protein